MSAQQSSELQPFVDEEDEQKPKAQEMDLDQTCAYLTAKVVRIRDKNLGLLYWGIVTLVMLYVIIIALGVEGKHQYQEPGVGTCITRLQGKGFAGDKAFDKSDLRFPEIEPFGAFLATKIITLRSQKIDNCVDFDNPCPCRKGAECVGGFCKDQAWCPSLGEGNIEKPQGATVTEIKNLENMIVEIHAGIAFPGIGNFFYVVGASKGATNPLRNMTLANLLKMAQPPVSLDDIKDTGALLGVSFWWNCDIYEDFCEPNINVKYLDNGKGFWQQRATHRTEGGVDVRDAMMVAGIRIVVDSSGLGRKFSFVLVMIQVGSGLALLRTASMASDFMMLQLYPKVRREAYYKCKVIETEDYSDLQDRINLIKENTHETHALLGKVVSQGGRGGAGAGVTLGLGAGGRGGMATAILRGPAA